MVNDIINKTNNNMLDSIKRLDQDFISLINSRLGISIKTHQIDDMNKTILKYCTQENCSPQYYLDILRHSLDNSPELEHLVAGITVGETYFFRDSRQMKLLRETVLPKIIQSKREQNNLSLRIWSAGCSSGEEIYTIAMMLIDMLADINRWRLQLLGTDINTSSLRKAIEGVYSEWSMRSISDYHKQKHFSYQDKKYILNPAVRDLVNFIYLNLNDDTYPSIGNNTNAQDLILCRNVLIYFDYNNIECLMKKIDASMVEDGFLLLGASDPILIKNTNFVSCEEGTLFLHSSQQKTKKIEKKPDPIVKISTIKKTEERIIKAPITTKSLNATSKEAINSLLDEGRWLEAVNTIDNYQGKEIKSDYLLNSKASALANLGKLIDAEKICHQCLKLHPTHTDSHFTLAMIYAEQGYLGNAESYLRKTLFLDPYFVAGHFQLGLLLIKNKRKTEGLKSLNNALSIALSKTPSQKVNGIKGLNYEKLAEILKHEIELYA